MRILRNQEIEEIAASRLVELERLLGRPLSLPIPIDLIAERVLGLDFLWEPIDQLPGEKILGGLIAKKRLIVLNENHRGLFTEKPGLERSTKGHEMGHWDLLIDKSSLDHPTLFDVEGEGPFAQRSSPAGEVSVIKALYSDPEGRELLRKIQARADEPDEARAVNRYAAALSMPAAMIRADAMRIDRTRWPNLYRLAEKYEVTITALRIRLEQLGLLYVDKDGKLYESPDAASGQGRLGF
ncbi:MAG: ImmA/IrrE family metallo-endopeptidase [Planctomycetota bacterium]